MADFFAYVHTQIVPLNKTQGLRIFSITCLKLWCTSCIIKPWSTTSGILSQDTEVCTPMCNCLTYRKNSTIAVKWKH